MKTKLLVAILLLASLSLIVPVASAAESSTDIQIQVQENGDAEWTVTNQVSFANDNERTAFERMSNNQTQMERVKSESISRFQNFADRASSVVDRDMSLSDSTVDTQLNGDGGTITVTFTWSNFAQSANSSAVVVSDIFEGGFSLEESQSMTVSGPFSDVSTDSPDATVEGSSVKWEGPVDVNQDVTITFEGSSTGGESGGEGLPGFGLLAGLTALIGLGAWKIKSRNS